MNPPTKTLITEFSLAEPDNKLAEALSVAKNSVKWQEIGNTIQRSGLSNLEF